jgi:hypothetical protein
MVAMVTDGGIGAAAAITMGGTEVVATIMDGTEAVAITMGGGTTVIAIEFERTRRTCASLIDKKAGSQSRPQIADKPLTHAPTNKFHGTSRIKREQLESKPLVFQHV